MSVKKVVKSAIFVIAIFNLVLFSVLNAIAADGFCPAYPAPSGATVVVNSEMAIRDAVNSAQSGTTILIADGTYNLGSKGYYLWLDTPGVTLRSQSGLRGSVILDDNYSRTEIITIAASNVTIADLTIKRAGTHPIHVVSTNGGDTLNALIYNVHIIDPGQQAIKINPHSAKINFTDYGEVACSTIELTDTGRSKVWDINGSCYTGGVDAHQSRGWVIRDNIIKGFWCQQGLSEHGVHFWTGGRDTIVERNRLIDNARGIGFGLGSNDGGRTYADNPCPGAGGYVGHFGGVIRNNFISASRAELFASQYGADGGIALAQACHTVVVHNTVAFTQAPFAAIEWRFSNTDADLINNLVTHNLMDRGGTANLVSNLSNQPLSMFVTGQVSNLHLNSGAAAAIDQGAVVAAGICDDDFDGQNRPANAGRDIGADEFSTGSTSSSPVADDLHMTVDQNSIDNPITLTGSDVDRDTLTFTVTTPPSNGSLGGSAPDLVYTPHTGFIGNDTFNFTVNDGTSDSAPAIVTISVQEVVQGTGNTGSSSNSGADGGGGGGCFIKASRR